MKARSRAATGSPAETRTEVPFRRRRSPTPDVGLTPAAVAFGVAATTRLERLRLPCRFRLYLPVTGHVSTRFIPRLCYFHYPFHLHYRFLYFYSFSSIEKLVQFFVFFFLH